MKIIPVDKLRRGMILGTDIYDSENARLLLKKNTSLTDGMIAMLRERGIKTVQTRADMAAVFAVRGLDDFPDVPKPEPVLTGELRDNALQSLADVYDAFSISSDDIHKSSRIIQHLDNVVDEIIDSITDSPHALVNIADLKSYDEYTYHHSLSVAVLGIAVAQYFGFARDDLRQIGMCAMMHDIGKIAIPIEIINKNTSLTPEEIEIVRRHPREGVNFLERSGFADELLLHGVLHHHEKFDGTGYPDRLSGYDIPLNSRIIALADVYDALTSNRPYRIPMQPADALEYIMGNVNAAFDYETVFAFLNKVEMYPVGSRVELSNGEKAVVLRKGIHLRPVVRTADGKTIDLGSDRRMYNVVITRLLPE